MSGMTSPSMAREFLPCVKTYQLMSWLLAFVAGSINTPVADNLAQFGNMDSRVMPHFDCHPVVSLGFLTGWGRYRCPQPCPL